MYIRIGRLKGFSTSIWRGKIFTVLASVNHIYCHFLLSFSRSYEVTGESGQVTGELQYKIPPEYTAEIVQSKVFQMLSKRPQKARFPW